MTVITITVANTAGDPASFNAEEFIRNMTAYVEAVHEDSIVCKSEISTSEGDLWTALDEICPTDSVMSVPSPRSIAQHNSKLRLIQGGKA